MLYIVWPNLKNEPALKKAIRIYITYNACAVWL